MNSTSTLDSRLEKLGKQSRRAAFVSILGFLLVAWALIYAAMQLEKLQAKQQELARQVRDTTEELKGTRQELEGARKALSSTRAAINAFHSGDFSQAVSLYDEALSMDPENAYIQNLRAYALFRLKRIDDAIAGERRSVAADPQYAWGYFDLARFLCAAAPSRMDEARRAALKAIDLRPDMREIMRQDGEFQRVCRGRVP